MRDYYSLPFNGRVSNERKDNMRYTEEQHEALAKASLNFMREIKDSGLFKELPPSAHASVWAMKAVLDLAFTPLNKRDRIFKKLLVEEQITCWEEL